MSRCIAILLLLSSISHVKSATYYVDYMNGSDSANGTTTNTAFKHCSGDANATELAAAASLAPGDIIKFKGGVIYTGSISVANSGTLASIITYDGNYAGDWGTGKAVIDCNYALSASALKVNSGVNNIRIDGFELRNCGGYADNDQVVIDAANGVYGNSTNSIRVPLPGIGLYLASRNTNIYCSNLYIHHIGIWHHTIGWDGRSVSGNGVLMYSPYSVTLTNCEITKVGASGVSLYATAGANNVLITDCYLHDDIPQWAIEVTPTGIGVTLSDITITKSRFVDLWSNWSGTPDDPAGTGTTNPHQNYIFLRTAGNLSYWTNVFVTRCYFTETSDTHILLGGTGSIFISTGPSVNIWNNVFSRPWSYTGTIPIYYPVPSGMHQIVRIYNNTFLRGCGTQIVSAGSDPEGARELYVENNILVNESNIACNGAMLATSGTYDAPTVLNHNIYWCFSCTVAQMYPVINNGSYQHFASLAASGWESNGYYTDPQLVDSDNATPSLRNLRLTGNSQARGMGRDLSAYFTDDYDGKLRVGKWDIGAYQYTPPQATIGTLNVTGTLYINGP